MRTQASDLSYWTSVLDKIARPVLEAASDGTLASAMPKEGGATLAASQLETSHLEAFGRLVSGIAPWLEADCVRVGGAQLQSEFRVMVREGIRSGVDPSSSGYLRIGKTRQSLVDTAFLALGILRAPTQLWHALGVSDQERLVEALRSTRDLVPYFNNWLLFSAIIETALGVMGASWDKMRVDYALRQHEQWYVGDGTYRDGQFYHCDYYNSFVIHPMLLAIADHLPETWPARTDYRKKILARATRYAELLERMISPEGTFPVVGRSITYRFGAFHLLSDMCLRDQLPKGLLPVQARCALTAVMRRIVENPNTFDKNGWLRVGLVGGQSGLAESYISTGSLYLCATVLLPLGLPMTHPFWADASVAWTSVKAWDGIDFKADHALPD